MNLISIDSPSSDLAITQKKSKNKIWPGAPQKSIMTWTMSIKTIMGMFLMKPIALADRKYLQPS